MICANIALPHFSDALGSPRIDRRPYPKSKGAAVSGCTIRKWRCSATTWNRVAIVRLASTSQSADRIVLLVAKGRDHGRRPRHSRRRLAEWWPGAHSTTGDASESLNEAADHRRKMGEPLSRGINQTRGAKRLRGRPGARWPFHRTSAQPVPDAMPATSPA